MSSAFILARNLLANWVGFGANLVVLLFLSPFIMHTLGKSSNDVWSLLTVLTGYLNIMDVGVRASTGRYIIYYLGKNDRDKVNETLQTGLGFYSCLGGVILLAAIGMGWFFPILFPKVEASFYPLVKLLLPLLAVNLWINAWASIFSSVLSAHDRFDLARGSELITLAVRTAGTIWALKAGYGLIGLTVVVLGSNLLGLVWNVILARRVHPDLRAWPLRLNKDRVRELYNYGGWAFISSMSILIIGKTDLIIVGAAMVAAGEVTIYNVGATLVYYSGTIIHLIASTFFPPVQRAVVSGRMGEARWLFMREVRLALMVGVPLLLGLCFFAPSFIHLWMFNETEFPASFVSISARITLFLAISHLFQLVVMGGDGLLAAMGHVRLTATLSAVEAGLNLTLSLLFVFVLNWGLLGVAAGTLVSRTTIKTLIVPWFVCHKANIPLPQFLWQIGCRYVIIAVTFSGLCLLIQHLFMHQALTWPNFFKQVLLVLLGYSPIAWWVLVPADDRQRLWQRLRSYRARRKTRRRKLLLVTL